MIITSWTWYIYW